MSISLTLSIFNFNYPFPDPFLACFSICICNIVFISIYINTFSFSLYRIYIFIFLNVFNSILIFISSFLYPHPNFCLYLRFYLFFNLWCRDLCLWFLSILISLVIGVLTFTCVLFMSMSISRCFTFLPPELFALSPSLQLTTTYFFLVSKLVSGIKFHF